MQNPTHIVDTCIYFKNLDLKLKCLNNYLPYLCVYSTH